jgi:membrane-bound lytic murein transglycosylase F
MLPACAVAVDHSTDGLQWSLQYGLYKPLLTDVSERHPSSFDGAATSDLKALRHRGTLRVLMMRDQGGEPGGRDVTFERELVADFAHSQGMTPEWVTVDTPRELVKDLNDGRGDVAIGDTPLRLDSTDIAHTVPLKTVRDVVVARADDQRIKSAANLAGLRVGLRDGSPVWPLLVQLNAGHGAIRRVSVVRGTTPEQLLDGVASGRYDATVLESQRPRQLLRNRPGLRVAFDLTGDEPVSWLLRADSPELKAALDRHLQQHRMAWRVHDTYTDDLDGILKRGVLRVITRRDPDNYFLCQGDRAGFEYDLIREFARRRGLRIEVVVADSEPQMVAWLKAGVGDVITARLDRDLVRNEPTLAQSRVFNYVAPVLVARNDLPSPQNLRGRTVLVAADSLEARALRAPTPQGYKVVPALPQTDIAARLQAVAEGKADYALVDAPALQQALRHEHDLKAVMDLDDRHPYRFTTRADNFKLGRSLNAFIKKIYGSNLYRVAYRRYFEKNELNALNGTRYGEISPYDDLVRRYADRYAFDWRLIVAQMYQESHFDPDATSVAGARGLMQLMPATAHALGVKDVTKPEIGVSAGVKYLDKLRSQFEDTLPVESRTWFAIAAYHAGFERVQAARRQAKKMGLDPDRWFGNVEKAMLAMGGSMQPGAVRGWTGMTVAYVLEIRSRYEAYLQLGQPNRVAFNGSDSRRVRDGS